MVTSSNSTTIFTPRGTPVPRCVTADWLNADPEINTVIAEVALGANARLPHDDGFAFFVMMAVVDAIRDAAALVIQYRNGEGEVTARVLFPSRIAVTSEGHLAFKAWCSARREVRTFRIDGVLDCHALTMPFESAA